MVRKHTIGIKINVPPELAKLIEEDAAAIGVGKTTYVRMLLYQHYRVRLQPRRLPASPVGPGAKGLEVAGPEGRDEARPLVKENAAGGESG